MFQISPREQHDSQAINGPIIPGGLDGVASRIEQRHLPNDPEMVYYYYEATHPDPHLPIMVAVHGISRQAEAQARFFAPLVEAVGGTVVAPLFPKDRYPDYQRLGRHGKGERADLALQSVLKDVGGHTTRSGREMVMFGYSGGGQFVHRYAMAYPRQVLGMAIAAPGWYTLPTARYRFPQGVGKTAWLPDLYFDAARFLKIPTLVLVGEADTLRDNALNQRAKIDHRQGKTRVERAGRWLSAMSAAAARYGYTTPYTSFILPGCGHSFGDCMAVKGVGMQIMTFLLHPPHPSPMRDRRFYRGKSE